MHDSPVWDHAVAWFYFSVCVCVCVCVLWLSCTLSLTSDFICFFLSVLVCVCVCVCVYICVWEGITIKNIVVKALCRQPPGLPSFVLLFLHFHSFYLSFFSSILIFLFCFVLFFETGFPCMTVLPSFSGTSSCRPCWPWTPRDSPASAFCSLGIKACATTAHPFSSFI